METWDAIRSRRNVRAYSDEPIPDDDLKRILEAGRRAPSSRNQQRWDFVVVTDRGELEELATVWRGAVHVATSAATVGLVAPHAPEERVRSSIQFDLGQATMAMMLAAADLGIASGHSAVEDHVKASRLLQLPDDRFLAWLLAFGYPKDRPLRPIESPDRRPLGDVVHIGTF